MCVLCVFICVFVYVMSKQSTSKKPHEWELVYLTPFYIKYTKRSFWSGFMIPRPNMFRSIKLLSKITPNVVQSPIQQKNPQKTRQWKEQWRFGEECRKFEKRGTQCRESLYNRGREPSDNYGHHSRDSFQASSEKWIIVL